MVMFGCVCVFLSVCVCFFFHTLSVGEIKPFFEKTMANDKKCVPGANPQPNKKN